MKIIVLIKIISYNSINSGKIISSSRYISNKTYNVIIGSKVKVMNQTKKYKIKKNIRARII
jgi:hypothetical protein